MSEFPSNFSTYTIEGAAALLLAVCAYKIYKLRVRTESDCCKHGFKMITSSRGASNNDLPLADLSPPSEGP